MALTTPQEIIDNSQAGRDFPKSLFDIDSVEETLVNDCLGSGLWAAMLENLTDLSEAVNWECTSGGWDCGPAYSIDDIVKKDGYYWTSTANNNTTIPCKESANWIKTPKFTTECYNKLWSYLVKVIAARVYSEAMPFAIVNSGTGGLTISGTDRNQERSMTPAEVVILQKPILSKANQVLENMKVWMKETECVFPDNPFTEECVENCVVPVYSRFFFRGPSTRFPYI